MSRSPTRRSSRASSVAPVTFDEMVNAEADVYQREIDQQLGLLSPVSAA